MLSVVIPVYNRRNNLLLCLAALDRQTYRDFEVIVADDGSTDLPIEMVSNYLWHFHRRYVWQEHAGVRPGQARNMGSLLAQGSALVFVDADVLLNPTALGHYANLHNANPDAIIGGRYDWLPPMQITMQDVQHDFNRIITRQCPQIDTGGNYESGGEYLGIQGEDPRASGRWFDSSVIRYNYCLALFSGNVLWPTRIFRDLGGFDENIVLHGGEDCEIAMRAQEHGIPTIFSAQVVGYHVWHHRDQEANLRGVAENIAYMASKHNFSALGITTGDPVKGQLPLIAGKDISNAN